MAEKEEANYFYYVPIYILIQTSLSLFSTEVAQIKHLPSITPIYSPPLPQRPGAGQAVEVPFLMFRLFAWLLRA